MKARFASQIRPSSAPNGGIAQPTAKMPKPVAIANATGMLRIGPSTIATGETR